MADISAKDVMKLRQETNLPMMKCKAALTEAGGDFDKAKDILRKQGLQTAEGKSHRETKEGYIANYIHHNGRVGVLVEMLCESDFVARNEDFQALGKDFAMHVASARPKYLSRDDVDASALEKEREVARERFLAEGKPEKIVEKIVDGQMNKFYESNCLLDQEFVKAENKESVQDTLKAAIAKIGENITIARFVCYELGSE